MHVYSLLHFDGFVQVDRPVDDHHGEESDGEKVAGKPVNSPHVASLLLTLQENKTGTSPVGAISEAQKCSSFFYKKVAQCRAEKLKKSPFSLVKRFYKPKISKKCKGVPLIEFENFRKKSHSAEKKPKGGPFGFASTFGSIKICDLVRESNLRNPASQKIS